jgi:predicted GNAT family N-acyltransferase
VLRDPLGLKFDPEELKLESTAFHFGAFENGTMLGTLMFAIVDDEPETLRMRQVAVDFNTQSKGVGKKLVTYAEDFAIREGYQSIRLHARDTAVPFYLALGYEKVGDMFVEVGIPHQEMVKPTLG